MIDYEMVMAMYIDCKALMNVVWLHNNTQSAAVAHVPSTTHPFS